MARGWDSKAIEDQIGDAEAARAARARPELSPEVRQSLARLKSLESSRVQVLSRLEAARDERYRVQLRAALAHLDSEIGAAGIEVPDESESESGTGRDDG